MTMKILRKIWFIPVVLLLGVVLLYMYMTQPSFRMTMDVNPSIEVVTNRLERVIEVNAKNDDAAKMLDGYVIKDDSLEGTVGDLVDRMIFEGFIHGGQDNMVMISVSDEDADAEIVGKINRAIQAYLENRKIEATILSTSLDIVDEDLTGKEKAAKKLSELGVTLSEEELSRMTLKELFEYSRVQNISQEELFHIVSGYQYEDDLTETGMLTPDEVRSIALNEVPGEIIKLELDDDEYEVKILSGGIKYELEIHAFTGTVTEIDRDDDTEDDKKEQRGTRITLEEARKIALGRVNGTIVEEDSDDDSYDFEIRLNGKEYEIEIHAYTGAIEEYEVEDQDDDDDRDDRDDDDKEQAPVRTRLTLTEARKIALGRVNGTIVEEDSDDDSYDFEIRLNGKEYEVEIHAYTGAIEEYEVENLDDDDDRDDQDDDDDKVEAPVRTRLTLAEARKIALGRVNGTIVEEDSDDDSYEFEIRLNGKEYEIEIHAYTGEIEEFEVDDED